MGGEMGGERGGYCSSRSARLRGRLAYWAWSSSMAEGVGDGGGFILVVAGEVQCWCIVYCTPGLLHVGYAVLWQIPTPHQGVLVNE